MRRENEPAMSTEESVVQKIKKLLALADGNQNEHERAVAMQFALDLLAKHNLSMTEVQGLSLKLDIKTEEVEGNFKLDPWIRIVLLASCKLYYTEYFIRVKWDWLRERNERTPIFVGTAENIAVTIDVADWLIKSIRKESNWMYRDEYERRSFRIGAGDRIMERVIEMTEAEKRQGVGAKSCSNSLMVLRNQLERANQEHLAKLDLRHSKGRARNLDVCAYVDGAVYGNEVRLGRQDASIRGRLTVNMR